MYGLVSIPDIKDYWSDNPIYHSEFISRAMSRNRFLDILHSLHLADNSTPDPNDALWKISPIIQILNKSFRKYWTTGDRLTADEAMIAFRGRKYWISAVHEG